MSAKIEAELALLDDAAERAELLAAYGLRNSGLDALIAAAARELRLQTFFTVGPLEARSWRVRVGATAQQAAAEIHTDLADTFIAAQVIALEDVLRHGGDEPARKAGCARTEGKDYVMRDGDVVVFRAGSAKKR